MKKNKLTAGFKKLALTLFLMFTGPVILYQAFSNIGHQWYYFVLVIGLIVGGRLIVEIELSTVSIIIAISIIFAALVNFFGFRINKIEIKYERPITSVLGFFSGILGGLSTFYGPPILTYLISVNLSKEFFIRTIATMYFIGSIPLYGSLLYHGLGTLNDLFVSLFLIVPALIGQYFGTKIRHKLSNEIFRKSILITLMILGLILLFKNF